MNRAAGCRGRVPKNRDSGRHCSQPRRLNQRLGVAGATTRISRVMTWVTGPGQDRPNASQGASGAGGRSLSVAAGTRGALRSVTELLKVVQLSARKSIAGVSPWGGVRLSRLRCDAVRCLTRRRPSLRLLPSSMSESCDDRRLTDRTYDKSASGNVSSEET